MNKISNPRTYLLTQINHVLQRPPTLRNPSECKTLKLKFNQLIQIGVSAQKMEYLRKIPDSTMICVCRLGNCCSNAMNCSYCEKICSYKHVDSNIWMDQPEPHLYTVSENGMRITAITVPFVDEENGQVIETFRLQPVPVLPCARSKKYQPKCRNGDNCRFHQIGICVFSHE